MAFNFGNTSTLGATSTPAKPGGFGNFSFLGNTTTSAPGAFGTNTQSTGFGAPAFGQTSTFGTPAFGGAPTAATGPVSAAPAFGFNTPATNANTGFAFGQLNQQQATGLGAFGTGGTTGAGFGTGLGTSFGGGGFGAQPPAATSVSTGFTGFGTGLGFGAAPAATTSAFSFNTGFGTNTAPPSFGGFGASSNTFGKPATGGFGTFGQPVQQIQPQQQPQQQQALSPDEAFDQSIFNVSIYGDERDTVIAKWNYLQANWGTGKAFYTQNAAPVEITPHNYLCRFKAIGYNKMPGKDNKMGLVSIIINKAESAVRDQKQQIINQLNQAFGNRPNLVINVDSIEAVSEGKAQVVIFVQEKSQISNETKRILASEVSNFLNQPMIRPQLANSLGVEDVVPLISPDEDQLKEYLEKPPKGIDPRMWNQAKQDNPDPKKFIPVPIIGFNELKQRIKCQEKETEMHSLYLAKVQSDLDELKQKHIDATAKILAHKRKLADLSHQILHIIVKQEITRKVGMALSPEEEILRSKLENMQALISAPTQYKGRLNELLSQMRMQRNQWNLTNINDYALDPDSTEEMKTFLSMQQKAMSFLIETANRDMETLKDIHTKMSEIVQS